MTTVERTCRYDGSKLQLNAINCSYYYYLFLNKQYIIYFKSILNGILLHQIKKIGYLVHKDKVITIFIIKYYCINWVSYSTANLILIRLRQNIWHFDHHDAMLIINSTNNKCVQRELRSSSPNCGAVRRRTIIDYRCGQ